MDRICVSDWFCCWTGWERTANHKVDKRYSSESDILLRSIAKRFWTDIKIYGSSLFRSDLARSSHQLETSLTFLSVTRDKGGKIISKQSLVKNPRKIPRRSVKEYYHQVYKVILNVKKEIWGGRGSLSISGDVDLLSLTFSSWFLRG